VLEVTENPRHRYMLEAYIVGRHLDVEFEVDHSRLCKLRPV
jgi:hypothetical protein